MCDDGEGLVEKKHSIYAEIIVSGTTKTPQQMFHSRDRKPGGNDKKR